MVLPVGYDVWYIFSLVSILKSVHMSSVKSPQSNASQERFWDIHGIPAHKLTRAEQITKHAKQAVHVIRGDKVNQAMVPNYMITISSAGQNKPILLACSRWFQWARPSTDDEYVKKARAADQQYDGVEVGIVGPVENKLLSFEQVWFSAEISEATHKLLDTSRVRVLWRFPHREVCLGQ